MIDSIRQYLGPLHAINKITGLKHMEHNIFWYIYCQPLYRIVFAIIIIIAIWMLLGRSLGTWKIWIVVNWFIVILSLVAIYYLTLYRNEKEKIDLILIPFYSLLEMKEHPEIGRQMLMNLFLFVPLGLSVPYAISSIINNRSRTVFFSISFAFCLSVFIECIQFFLKLGRCEMDDVIMNTFGAIIGEMSYIVTSHKCICHTNDSD